MFTSDIKIFIKSIPFKKNVPITDGLTPHKNLSLLYLQSTLLHFEENAFFYPLRYPRRFYFYLSINFSGAAARGLVALIFIITI